MDRESLVNTLLAIDEEFSLAATADVRPKIIIVGGAAFFLHDFTERQATHDIDILHTDAIARDVLSHYPNVNGAVVAYEDHLPYNFEDRLVALDIGAQAIDFCTPSIEDLIVMKLYAERPHDLQDIDEAARCDQIDWKLLGHLVYDPDEARGSVLVPRRYDEMVGAFERFRERWQR